MRIGASSLLAAATFAACAFAAPIVELTPIERSQLASLSPVERDALVQTILTARDAEALGAPLTLRELGNAGAAHLQRSAARAGTLTRRANPSGSYGPDSVSCPAASGATQPGGGIGQVRYANSNALSSGEQDYINRKRSNSQQGWQQWLSSTGAGPDLDGANGIPGGVANYTSAQDRLPRVGIALSGGGYRAMIVGSGVLAGFDSRNQTANDRGVGGFLQLADYVAGLSGGSWAVGGYAINDWPTSQQLKDGIWDLEKDLVVPDDGKLSYYTDIGACTKKRGEGYPTSITDYWGRALSYHLVNDTTYPDQGQGTTFGDIRNTSSFTDARMPFPVVIADEREPGQLVLLSNETQVFEFNPYEAGSWDSHIDAFIPIDILGTAMQNGESTAFLGRCTVGFDNFGWVVGTSSTLFNSLYSMLITSNNSSDSSIIRDAIEAIAGAVSDQRNDVSVVPNPFSGLENRQVASQNNITLVDGGEDGANIPFWPLIQPARNLDLVVGVDSSADVSDWPNGTAIRETFLRASGNPAFSDVSFPMIPTQATFVNRGLNTRPTFFGCNRSSLINVDTAGNNTISPLIIYLPSYPYSALANSSTFKLSYSDDEADWPTRAASSGPLAWLALPWNEALSGQALRDLKSASLALINTAGMEYPTTLFLPTSIPRQSVHRGSSPRKEL
ncbi:lysophospholipase plb1 [Ceraceosorus bombacis]|uniref:Lysophospholipase n=1 Tax=Ceraceosorus bombacis TaxID=401625 RepID=A0A0P1BSJ6_9BASI|nr:lysophospholipase plb1 [Ceraceosorus bombacis]